MRIHVLCFLTLSLLWMPGLARGGSFTVFPVKVFIGAEDKIVALKIANKGNGKLSLQLQATLWSQDEHGEDLYRKTQDILFFPKILTLEKDEQRVVRIAYKGKPVNGQEATYRLFLEELPVTAPGTTVLRMLLKVGVPIFVQPAEARTQWAIGGITAAHGRASIAVSNEGNHHVIVTGVTVTGSDAQGTEVFTHRARGWYVLAGSSRPFVVPLPPGECPQVRQLKVNVEVDGENKEAESRIGSDPAVCTPEGEDAPG